jgi:hypothetical protein
MLNPDGVINGFYRTSYECRRGISIYVQALIMLPLFVCRLSGHDMNRCWDAPDPVSHAPIAKLKELLAGACAYPGVDLFCDVHGHSRKEGIFMYGCVPPSSTTTSRNLPRVLPMLLSKTCPAFKYEGCDFKVCARLRFSEFVNTRMWLCFLRCQPANRQQQESLRSLSSASHTLSRWKRHCAASTIVTLGFVVSMHYVQSQLRAVIKL